MAALVSNTEEPPDRQKGRGVYFAMNKPISVPLEDIVLTPTLRRVLSVLDASACEHRQAISLPRECYISEEWFEFEKRAIFDRNWVCVGHAQLVPNPGDYVSICLNEDPLLLLRDTTGIIRVMSAVCPHRGRVIGDARGNVEQFVCPLHHWTYDLTGKLIGAPEMNGTLPLEALQREAFLPVLRSELWNGFIFINMDGRAKPLGPRLKRLTKELANHNMEGLVAVPTMDLTGYQWNWKYMQENAIEPYHTTYLHGGVHDFAPSRLATFYDWDPEDDGAVFHPTGFLYRDGNFNMSFRCLFPVIGTLTEEERSRVMFATIPPNLFIAALPDGVLYYLILPHGANALTLRVGYLYPETTMKMKTFDQVLKAVADGIAVYNDRDVESNTSVHLGLRSRFARRTRYSPKEATLSQFNRWLIERYQAYAAEVDSKTQRSQQELSNK
jgi:phenylpropionate dioxygenase-like ring-hydroxylating dioxygenase large terminal subunit